MDHAGPVQGDHNFSRTVIETLANDQDGLVVVKSVRIRIGDIGCQRDVARHFLPEEAKLVARVPDVVSGGFDGVLLRVGVVGGAPSCQRAANVGLALEYADRRLIDPARPVKVGRRRHLDMG